MKFQADKAVAEKKLSAAKPALEEAEAALQVGLAPSPSFYFVSGARKAQFDKVIPDHLTQ